MPTLRFIGGMFKVATMRIAFVSFASGRYIQYESAFRESIARNCPEADVFVFNNPDEIGAPPHYRSPYSFKPYAVDHVRKMGYQYIIWCDSVVRLRRNIEPLLPAISQVGVYLQADGWRVGQWANDRSLSYFGLTRDQAMEIEAIYACIMGFDFQNPVAAEFLARWKKASVDGIFIGNWKNDIKTESQDERCRGHRHDQTCAELISYQLGIPRKEPLLRDEQAGYFTTYKIQ
jgi:hypothetical protein